MKKEYVKPSAETVSFEVADSIMNWLPGTEEGTSKEWGGGFID